MPIYEYHCPTCNNKFEKLQSMSSTGADCPRCEQPAKRALSVFASITAGDSSGGPDLTQMPAPLRGGGCCAGGCFH